MTNKKAYELDGVSIGFIGKSPLGDAVVYKKVFEALTVLEPNCNIDILCMDARARVNAKAFYMGSKNLNNIVDFNNEELSNYDLVLHMESSAVLIMRANLERLQNLSFTLYQGILKLHNYNLKYNMYKKDLPSKALFCATRARIFKTNRYTCLACEGALPIYDNKVEINLLPEWKNEFDKLGLKRYITLGSNGGNFGRYVIKEWPTRYYVEFISLLKSKMPDITVVQTGGNGVIEFENADRKLLGTDLELFKYILKNSLLHIDCEGGPVHLASQLGTKCLVLFGAIEPDFLKYTPNINIISEVCSPCYGVWESGSKCLLGAKEPPCMLSITPQKVFDVAYRYLKSIE